MKTTIKMAALAGMMSLAAMAGAGPARAATPAVRDDIVTLQNHRFAVGDLLCRDASSGQYKVVPVGQLVSSLEQKQALFIVTDSQANRFAVAPIEYSGNAPERTLAGAVLWTEKRTHGQGMTLKSDGNGFVRCLLETAGELLVTQNANGFRLGDVVCLNEQSGYFVKVTAGCMKQEEQRGTALFLVTDRKDQSAEFCMTRVRVEADAIATAAGVAGVAGVEYARAQGQ